MTHLCVMDGQGRRSGEDDAFRHRNQLPELTYRGSHRIGVKCPPHGVRRAQEADMSAYNACAAACMASNAALTRLQRARET